MSKTVCSLVLNQEVLDKVDREALIKNVSRSQVINDLLCAHYGVHTPALKMMQVMTLLSDALQSFETMDVVSAIPGSTLQLKTQVAYRYNPTLKFVVELSGKDTHQLGVLKIYSRTISGPFLQQLVMFFNYLTSFEEGVHQTIGHRQVESTGYFYEDNKFIRVFNCEWNDRGIYPEMISRYLAHYIQFVDEALKVFFLSKGNWLLMDQTLQALYKKYW